MRKPAHRSSFDVVASVDGWPYFEDDPEAYRLFMRNYYAFMIDSIAQPVGLIHIDIIRALPWPNGWSLDDEKRRLILHGADTFEARTKAVEEALLVGRRVKASPSLRVWQNESFPVYDPIGRHLLDVDGSGVDVIGVRSFAVYLTAWTNTSEGRKYWVQRRGFNKTLLPGMLDCSVSGRLRPGEKPFDGMVREAGEEANLPESLLRQRMRPCDILAAAYPRSNQGAPAYMHHTQYVYELELDESVKLSCDTDEVGEFKLLTLEEIRSGIDEDAFIPIARLVYLAHFIRHGIVTTENDERLEEACARMHRRHQIFVPEA